MKEVEKGLTEQNHQANNCDSVNMIGNLHVYFVGGGLSFVLFLGLHPWHMEVPRLEV